MIFRSFALMTLISTLGLNCLAQSGESILPADIFSAMTLSGLPSAELSTTSVTGLSFSRAWRIRTPSKAPNPWDYRLVARPISKVSKGDTLVARLWIRATHAGKTTGYARLVMERTSDPFTKSLEWHVSTGPGWQHVEAPFTAAETYDPREYSVQIWLSHGPQEVEIGGLSIVNYGPNMPYSRVGLQDYPYAGMQDDAGWRSTAAARIEKTRKGDIVVVVNDENGKALPGATVRVSMRTHAFGFGSAVDAATLGASGADGDKYRHHVRQWFNKTVLENDLKWPEWERNRQRAISGVQWLQTQTKGPIRGHNLVWPGWQYLPGDLQFNQSSPDSLRSRVNRHIEDIVGSLKGLVAEWDVLNEPVSVRSLQSVVGDSEMAEWFRRARAADSAAKLYVNEYSILTGGGNDTPQQEAYFELVRSLNSQGAPIDGIGIQAHFDQQFTPPERLLAILDRYATLGKAIQITELSINTADEAVQAAYLRDFLTAAYSHPAVNGVLLWGFWEGRHFAPPAALIRKDWTMKPAARVWADLVLQEWWTKTEGKTSEQGIYRTRGFAGEYDVEIEHNGRTSSYSLVVVPRTGNYLQVGRPALGRIASSGIVHGATYARGAVSPGQILTIFGEGFGGDRLTTAQFDDGRLPTVVGDTSVTFDGALASMIYAAPGQVSAIAPFRIAGITTVQVLHRGTPTNPVRMPVAASSPGIFAGDGGLVVAVNAIDGTLVTPERPAPRGSAISLYLTGVGAVSPQPADGALIAGPEFPRIVQPVSVLFGTKLGRVLFQGLVYPGVAQINVEVPPDGPIGPEVPVVARVADNESPNSFTIPIR
jgi:uncharacterized protein (TIGR03437 family)